MKKYKKQIIIFFCFIIIDLLILLGIWLYGITYGIGLSVSPEIYNMEANYNLSLSSQEN